MKIIFPARRTGEVSATELRQKVAHGVSRGKTARRISPGRGGRFLPSQLSPLRGLHENPTDPRLTPWATICRCSAAKAERVNQNNFRHA